MQIAGVHRKSQAQHLIPVIPDHVIIKMQSITVRSTTTVLFSSLSFISALCYVLQLSAC